MQYAVMMKQLILSNKLSESLVMSLDRAQNTLENFSNYMLSKEMHSVNYIIGISPTSRTLK